VGSFNSSVLPRVAKRLEKDTFVEAGLNNTQFFSLVDIKVICERGLSPCPEEIGQGLVLLSLSLVPYLPNCSASLLREESPSCPFP